MTGFYLFAYTIAAPLIRLLFPHRVVGLENLPEGGALLCANHASGWDPIIIAIALPKHSRMTVMGKDQLFHIPILGFLLRKLGIISVKRGGNDLTAIKRGPGWTGRGTRRPRAA